MTRAFPGYRGRFAPTPSGPLHLGSLYTALASWLDARAAGGTWLLRIDDLDGARCKPGHVDTILRQLQAHGLEWDEVPRRQSQHLDEYGDALETLRGQGRLYASLCTGAVLASSQHAGPDGPVYPGSCRGRNADLPGALRLRLPDGRLLLHDRLRGSLSRDASSEVGDFTLRRADGIAGYQLSCAVDEAAQGITAVVRGVDLLGSSFRQTALMCALNMTIPSYAHLPVLVGGSGHKLSKQNHAQPIDRAHAADNLRRCLQWLGMPVPQSLSAAPVVELLSWARDRWSMERVGAATAIRVDRSIGSPRPHLA